MANKPPRIYISAMETEVTGLPQFDPQASNLLAKLAAAGYDVAWEKEFRGYDVIERDIAESDALLAIVDRTWAMGHFSMMQPPSPLMPPIPIFMYPVTDDAEERFPFNHHLPILLDRAVNKALQQAAEILPVLDLASA